MTRQLLADDSLLARCTDIPSLIDALKTLTGDRQVACILYGHDSNRCLIVHFQPLDREQLRSYDQWYSMADLRLYINEYLPITRQTLRQAAQQFWPGVKVYEFGCTCCSGDDLVEINGCFCDTIDEEHDPYCPLLIADKELRLDAVQEWHINWVIGRSGSRNRSKTNVGRAGYRHGRQARKDRYRQA